MNNNPLVSIIIPVYNGSNFIEEAIYSALNQSYSNIEIVVVNDGSADGGLTRECCLKFGNQIKYYEKENGGVSSALNYGVQKCNGEYIAWLSHDDMFSVDKIKNQVKSLSDGILPYCSSIFMDAKGNIEKVKLFSQNRKNNFSGVNSFFPINVCLASCLFPRKFLVEHKFNESARFNQDVEQYYNCLKYGFKFVYTKKAFYLSRNHKSRVSVTRLDLFEKDVVVFNETLIEDIEKTNNKVFFRKYLYFCVEKSQKYHFYKKIVAELLILGKEKNYLSVFCKIKILFIKFYAKAGFAIRKILVGR